MNYWLLKTEPEVWSWQQQLAKKIEGWDGVRNYQARNYLKQMQLGDRALFYHSGKERQIVGIVEIVRQHYPDQDPNFCCVDVKAVSSLVKPVTLQAIKVNTKLQDMVLLKNSRLSVQPVKAAEYEEVLKLSNIA